MVKETSAEKIDIERVYRGCICHKIPYPPVATAQNMMQYFGRD